MVIYVQCIMYIVQYSMYIVHCTVTIVCISVWSTMKQLFIIEFLFFQGVDKESNKKVCTPDAPVLRELPVNRESYKSIKYTSDLVVY